MRNDTERALAEAMANADVGSVLGDLLRVGILVRSDGGLALGNDVDLQTLRLFWPLLSEFGPRLRPVRIAGCPVHFCTGLVNAVAGAKAHEPAVSGRMASGGQGASAGLAAIACLGEMAERISLFIRPDGTDERLQSRCDTLLDLDAGAFLGFSPAQTRALWGRIAGAELQSDGGPHEWSALSDDRVHVTHMRTGQSAQLAAFAVMLGGGQAHPPFLGSTVGSAVHGTIEEATRRALLELAERDAIARAWYNRLWITSVPGRLVAQNMCSPLADFLEQRARVTAIFRVQTDLKVHVFAAVSHAPDGYGGAVGFAAARCVPEAMDGAVREMLQGEFSMQLTAQAAKKAGTDPSHASKALAYGRSVRISDDLKLGEWPAAETSVLERIYGPDELIESCFDEDIDLWLFDATRSDLKMPCAKVLSPDLCSWEPRFGKRRLYPKSAFDDPAQRRSLEEAYSRRPFPF
ncbi:MAG: YcaO-like family protein [Roseibium sp.]|nr:YcaO-like family protein [Roseibium sp.]